MLGRIEIAEQLIQQKYGGDISKANLLANEIFDCLEKQPWYSEIRRNQFFENRNYCNINDTIVIERNGVKYLVCKKCEHHEQMPINKYLDCKTIFYLVDKNGNIKELGQCMCYSKEHGKRK